MSARRIRATMLTLAALVGLLTAAVWTAGATGAPAGRAAANGITPIAPANGKTLPVGKQIRFRLRASGGGTVWVHVSKSKKRNKEGVIGTDASLGQAQRVKGGEFRYTPKLYTFPGFWLVTPGRYYWQAYRIKCEGDLNDCKLEGAIRSFRLRR